MKHGVVEPADLISSIENSPPHDAPPAVSRSNLLLVDQDPEIQRMVSEFLRPYGYAVEAVTSGAAMHAALARCRPDLIILDIVIPDEDGLSLLRAFAKNAPPVIILSSQATDIDRIVGLELGADDYVAKPCNPRELLARVRAVLRRRTRDMAEPGPGGRVLHFSGWVFDVTAHVLTDPDGNVVPLTSAEFRLLRSLAERPRRVLSRDQLLDLARGDAEIFSRTIDALICKLRRKLARANENELIQTVRSEGYVFVHSVVRH